MYPKLRFFSTVILQSLFVILLLHFNACGNGDSEQQKSEAPATLTNQVQENMLTTVSLSSEAEERLGIETSIVEHKMIPKTIKTGGEIMALPGQEVKVTAPVTGTVLGPQGRNLLPAGSFVRKGQEVMRLLLMPPEGDLLSAQEEVRVKEVEYEVMISKMKRADQLLSERAISEKSYEETQAELARTQAALNAARGRLNLLNNTNLDSVARNLSTLSLNAPLNGVIQNIFVTPDQTIPASTVMFEIARIDPVWIRVPVYIGYLSKIDRQKEATIIPMGIENDTIIYYAKPVQGPPLSDLNNASSDLYYEMENRNGTFRIGEKVSVILTQKSSEESLVIPWSSILYDMYGGSWVYIRTAPHIYSRCRVEVSHITDHLAVLTRGVQPNDEVVIAGNAEIFGVEFGGGK